MTKRLLWGFLPAIVLFVALTSLIFGGGDRADGDSVVSLLFWDAVFSVGLTAVPAVIIMFGIRREKVRRLSLGVFAGLSGLLVVSLGFSSDANAGLAVLVIPFLATPVAGIVAVCDHVLSRRGDAPTPSAPAPAA